MARTEQIASRRKLLRLLSIHDLNRLLPDGILVYARRSEISKYLTKEGWNEDVAKVVGERIDYLYKIGVENVKTG